MEKFLYDGDALDVRSYASYKFLTVASCGVHVNANHITQRRAGRPDYHLLYVESGDLEKALAYNTEALEYDDEDPIVLDNMAQTYYRLANDKEKALEYFKKAHAIKDTIIIIASRIAATFFIVLFSFLVFWFNGIRSEYTLNHGLVLN